MPIQMATSLLEIMNLFWGLGNIHVYSTQIDLEECQLILKNKLTKWMQFAIGTNYNNQSQEMQMQCVYTKLWLETRQQWQQKHDGSILGDQIGGDETQHRNRDAYLAYWEGISFAWRRSGVLVQEIVLSRICLTIHTHTKLVQRVVLVLVRIIRREFLKRQLR